MSGSHLRRTDAAGTLTAGVECSASPVPVRGPDGVDGDVSALERGGDGSGVFPSVAASTAAQQFCAGRCRGRQTGCRCATATGSSARWSYEPDPTRRAPLSSSPPSSQRSPNSPRPSPRAAMTMPCLRAGCRGFAGVEAYAGDVPLDVFRLRGNRMCGVRLSAPTGLRPPARLRTCPACPPVRPVPPAPSCLFCVFFARTLSVSLG